jgi:hypothetical protein
MSGMKLLTGLSLDQVSHPPGRPQASAIAQHLRTLFQSMAQLLQLRGLQPRFPTSSASLKERLGSLFSPRLVPPTDRLAMNPKLPGHLSLTKATVKKSGGLESPPFQAIEIAFYTFWIAHDQRLSR